jgi:hypothetical protein
MLHFLHIKIIAQQKKKQYPKAFYRSKVALSSVRCKMPLCQLWRKINAKGRSYFRYRDFGGVGGMWPAQ